MPAPPLRPRGELDPKLDEPLEDLPPMDGGAEDVEDPRTEEELEEAGEGEGGLPLDDATAEQDPVDPADVDVDDPQESGWLNELADNPDLDVGPDVIDLDQSPAAGGDDADGSVPVEEDLGLGEGVAAGGLDAGEEGPVDEDEELRDEDLPSLDADDEGDFEGEALLDDRFAADEPLGVGWAAVPWPRVGAPVQLPAATAIACAGRGALVAVRSESGAAELHHVDLEGTRSPVAAVGLTGDVRSVSVSAGRVAVVTADGQAYGSTDDGAHFVPLAKGVTAVDVAIGSQVLWTLTRAGGLWRAPLDGGGVATPLTVGGAVGAVAGDLTGGVTAVTVDAARRPTGVVRVAADGTVDREPAQGPLEPMGAARLAVRDRCIAYPTAGGVVRRTGDAQWRSFKWEGRVTALTFVDDEGTLVAATYSDAD